VQVSASLTKVMGQKTQENVLSKVSLRQKFGRSNINPATVQKINTDWEFEFRPKAKQRSKAIKGERWKV